MQYIDNCSVCTTSSPTTHIPIVQVKWIMKQKVTHITAIFATCTGPLITLHFFPNQVTIVYVSIILCYFIYLHFTFGSGGGRLVEAMRYKPEGRGFDPSWCHWNFLLT